MRFEIDLQTRQTIDYMIRELSNFQQNQAIKEGLRGAANVFAYLDKRNLTQRLKKPSWHLKYSITSRVRAPRKGGEPTVVGFERPDGNAAHLVDRGTKHRYTTSGADRGIMPANYFHSDARIEGEDDARDAVYRGVQRVVDRINSRM